MRAAGNRIAFRRTPVKPEAMQRPQFFTLPAPVRGWILSENLAFMTPGGAAQLDNFFPETDRLRVRAGSQEWIDTGTGDPIISGFRYVTGTTYRMFFSTEDTLFDCTVADTPTPVATDRSSGNCSASQLANEGGDWLLVLNSGGDFPLRFNGTSWAELDPTGIAAWAPSTSYVGGDLRKDTDNHTFWRNTEIHTSGAGTFAADRVAHPGYWEAGAAPDNTQFITGPLDSTVANGDGLSYVWKYKNRFFFIEGGTMNLWYLDENAIAGVLSLLPLSGACKRGGFLLWGATWSMDAGDGLDDKLVVATTEGELLIFTGSDPDDPNDWRQEGRYEVAKPMGMNAHVNIGGDIIIATTHGIVPLSQAISKDIQGLDLAALTRLIDRFWKQMVSERDDWPWMMAKWEEKNALFVSLPGGPAGSQWCLVANIHTGAWTRYKGWDATCFVSLQSNFFFGTTDGRIVQAEVSGTDEGNTYSCLYVGNWEHFGEKTAQGTWRQGRITYSTRPGETFEPLLTAATDYNIPTITYPSAPPDPGALDDVWDEALWDEALWDASSSAMSATIANTGWVSVGVTGYAFAPIVTVSIEQTTAPTGALISIDAIADQMAVAV